MKVKDLSGRWHNWKLQAASSEPINKSAPHIRARQILKELHPLYDIYEEPHIPGENLYLDLYVPLLKLAIEIHGEQHYKFVPHFHGSRQGFVDYVKRDKRKLDWCELNNITLVVLKHSEDDDVWRKCITESKN